MDNSSLFLIVVMVLSFIPMLLLIKQLSKHSQNEFYNYLAAIGFKYDWSHPEATIRKMAGRKGFVNDIPLFVSHLKSSVERQHDIYVIALESRLAKPFLAEAIRDFPWWKKLSRDLTAYAPGLVPVKRFFGLLGSRKSGVASFDNHVNFMIDSDYASAQLLGDDTFRATLLEIFSEPTCRQLFHDGVYLWAIFLVEHDVIKEEKQRFKWEWSLKVKKRFDLEKAESRAKGFQSLIVALNRLTTHLKRNQMATSDPVEPLSLSPNRMWINISALFGIGIVISAITSPIIVRTFSNDIIVSFPSLLLIGFGATALVSYYTFFKPNQGKLSVLIPSLSWFAIVLAVVPPVMASTPLTLNWVLDSEPTYKAVVEIEEAWSAQGDGRSVWAKTMWDKEKTIQFRCPKSIRDQCDPGARVRLIVHPGYLGYAWNYENDKDEWMFIEQSHADSRRLIN